LEFYLPIWAKEAKQALKDGMLPAQFYNLEASLYKNLFENFSLPEWAQTPSADSG
jgi:hypothetical protein